MKSNKKKNLTVKILDFLLLNVVVFYICLANVKNVQAENLLPVNFPKGSTVEHLKLDVPKKFKGAWLKAEEESWEPWLLKQDGFLGRQLFWDPKLEQATLLIVWKSRPSWKSIPNVEINIVQQNFEQIARLETGETINNPFPLIYEGELNPQ